MKKELFQFESRVTSVEVYNKSRCHYVYYREERKSKLWGLIKSTPAGYYTDRSDNYLGTEEDLLNGSYYIIDRIDNEKTVYILICENKKTYYRPYVSVKFESGKSLSAKFLTIEECNEYAKKIGEKFNLLDVTNKL